MKETLTPNKIRLSPSALNLYKNCRSCFWYDRVLRIRRPRGIYPSLPTGMDRVIKTYFDQYRRKACLPPELCVAAFKGIELYPDQKKLDQWREWRSGLVFTDEDGSVLSGALDDLLKKDKEYIPFDYKTKGSPTTAEAAVKYYQSQLDGYALMLEANGMSTAGYGFLMYFSPKTVGERGAVTFHLQAIKIETDTERAKQLLRDAVQFLNNTQHAELNTRCEYCAWRQKLSEQGF